jgi:translation initiation factor IF-1
MPGFDAIRLDGTVVQVLPNGLLRVELANGHQVLGHAPRRDRHKLSAVPVGGRVKLEMTPFDMSKARVLV